MTITDVRGALPFAVEYREVDPGSMGFVFSSWLESHHQGDPRTRAVPFARYKPTQRLVVQRALDTGRCVVAVDPEEDGLVSRRTIWGWACASNDDGVGVLHYVYVVQTRRLVGLGRDLVRMSGAACGARAAEYSHSTITGARFASKLGLVSNPFAVVRMVSQCA